MKRIMLALMVLGLSAGCVHKDTHMPCVYHAYGNPHNHREPLQRLWACRDGFTYAKLPNGARAVSDDAQVWGE